MEKLGFARFVQEFFLVFKLSVDYSGQIEWLLNRYDLDIGSNGILVFQGCADRLHLNEDKRLLISLLCLLTPPVKRGRSLKVSGLTWEIFSCTASACILWVTLQCIAMGQLKCLYKAAS